MKSGNRLLFITHQLSPTGAPIVLLDMITKCVNEGYDINLISMMDGTLREKVETLGITVQIKESFIHDMNEIREYALGFDCVICNTLITYEMIHILDGTEIPVIWWLHEGRQYFDYFKNVLPDFSKLHGNVHIFSVSHYVRNVVKDVYDIDTEILHFSVKKPDNIECKREKKSNNSKVRFMTSGTYSRIKGQDILADAIRSIPEDYMKKAEFIFTGNEEAVDEEVYSAVKRLEEDYDNVKIYHQVTREVNLDLMDSSDCLLVPSRIEPLPTVAIEMMMTGGVCVCTNICGISHYIEDGVNGYIVKTEDKNVLQDIIIGIIDNRDELSRIGRQAYKTYYENFCEEVLGQKCIDIISSSIENSVKYIKQQSYCMIKNMITNNELNEAAKLVIEIIEKYGINNELQVLIEDINARGAFI